MKLRIASLVAALLTLGAATARLQSQTRAHPPAPAKPAASASASAATSTPTKFTLKNGMRVTFVHTGSARKAVVVLELETGEIDEPQFGPGLAALTADMLLQGTVARSAQQIVTESAALGTPLSVHTGPIATDISGEVETTRIPRFLSLIADLVRHPLLDTAGFGRVRRHAVAALDSTLRDPAALARQLWRAVIFPDSPFGHPYAFAATLGMLQLGHVRNIYDDDYSASRAHLYVSGVFDDSTTAIAIREIFSDWKGSAPSQLRPVRSVTAHQLVTLDQPGAARSAIWIGLPVIDPADREFVKLEVADMLLAGHDSSRVALDIASIEGAAPRASSTIWRRRNATYWVDAFDVRTANTGAALAALIGELAALRREAPGEEEVNRARARLIAAFEARNNSRDGLVSLMEFMDEHSLGDGWRTGYVQRVVAVSRDDVRAAIQTYLDPQRMTIAVVGDRTAIDPQLAKLQPVIP